MHSRYAEWGLKPKELWQHFDALNAIARGSRNEAGVNQYIRQVAESARSNYPGREIRVEEDRAGEAVYKEKTGNANNLLVLIPGSEGCEALEPLALQGHTDMVLACDKDCSPGAAEGIVTPRLIDGWVWATGSTLGADNGIGVAAMLAVLSMRGLKHPPLQLLFTVREEEGLVGALSMDLPVTATRMLNLDSEDDKKMTVATAGGATDTATMSVRRQPAPVDAVWATIHVVGLLGGHSGLDIHRRRASAAKILATVFTELAAADVTFWLADLYAAETLPDGGETDNQIVTAGSARLALTGGNGARFAAALPVIQTTLQSQWGADEPRLQVQWATSPDPGAGGAPAVLVAADRDRVLQALTLLPHGVRRMSERYKAVVETSSNFALASVCGKEQDNARFVLSTRSLENDQREALRAHIRSVAESLGGTVKGEKAYPAWTSRPDSPLLQVATRVYKATSKDTSKDIPDSNVELEAVHAGLETSAFFDKIPGLQAVSFGPKIEGAHTTKERVNVQSVERFWELLTGLLAEMAAAPSA